MGNTTLGTSFNGTELTSINGLSVLATDPYRFPKRKLSIYNLVKGDANKITGGIYTGKTINIRIGISRNSRSNVEQSIDSLNALLYGLEKDLLVAQSGTTRRYVATLEDIVPIQDGGMYWEATLVFALSDLFGYEVNYQLIINATNLTSGIYGWSGNYSGSAEWQVPIIEIYYNSISTNNPASVIIGNGATGQHITINRTWVTGDRLIINAQTGSVSVNGAEVVYQGAIPKFRPGFGTVTYNDDFISRTFNVFIKYYKRFA